MYGELMSKTNALWNGSITNGSGPAPHKSSIPLCLLPCPIALPAYHTIFMANVQNLIEIHSPEYLETRPAASEEGL